MSFLRLFQVWLFRNYDPPILTEGWRKGSWNQCLKLGKLTVSIKAALETEKEKCARQSMELLIQSCMPITWVAHMSNGSFVRANIMLP